MLSTKKNIIVQHLLFSLIGFSFGALIGYVLLLDFFDKNFFTAIGLSGGCGVIALRVINFTNTILDKKIPWNKAIIVRFFLSILSNFFMAYLIFIIAAMIYKDQLFSKFFFSSHNQIIIKLAIVLLFVMMMYTFSYFTIQSYTLNTVSQLKLIELENHQTHLKLNALKSQLTPHFLFNSLNSISSLIDKDNIKAELFIRHLANLYQSILNLSTNDLILLKEEIDIVKSYTFLLESRFQDRFTCHIDISEEKLNYKVAPLTLQLLVENAVKHNELRYDSPIKITISIDHPNILVSNNINAKNKKEDSLKIGLSNISERYKLLGNNVVRVIDNKEFTVKIPLLS